MASFLQTLNNNLLYWIDCTCNSSYRIYDYSPDLSMVEKPASAYNYWVDGLSNSQFRYSSLYPLCQDQTKKYYLTVNNEKSNPTPITLARNYYNFAFNLSLIGYTVEMVVNVNKTYYAYTQEEVNDMDICLMNFISSRNSDGFKMGITGTDINSFLGNYPDSLWDETTLFEKDGTYSNCSVDACHIRYPFSLGDNYKIVFSSDGTCYIGGTKVKSGEDEDGLPTGFYISHTGANLNNNNRNSYFNLIFGNWELRTYNNKVELTMAPGFPGTIYYIRIYRSLADDVCRQLSKYGSTVEFSPAKKVYTSSRFVENRDIMSIDRNGKIEMTGEIIEGSSQFGFNKNGNLYVDEVVEI